MQTTDTARAALVALDAILTAGPCDHDDPAPLCPCGCGTEVDSEGFYAPGCGNERTGDLCSCGHVPEGYVELELVAVPDPAPAIEAREELLRAQDRKAVALRRVIEARSPAEVHAASAELARERAVFDLVYRATVHPTFNPAPEDDPEALDAAMSAFDRDDLFHTKSTADQDALREAVLAGSPGLAVGLPVRPMGPLEASVHGVHARLRELRNHGRRIARAGAKGATCGRCGTSYRVKAGHTCAP